MNPINYNYKDTSLAYINWISYLNGHEEYNTYEYNLYTDANIYDEIQEGLGPFKIFNTTNDSYYKKSLITFRVSYFTEDFYNQLPRQSTKTPDSIEHYHGASMESEIAALLSLSLGIRLKSGPVTRKFSNALDPKGKPTTIAVAWEKEPILSKSIHGVILPNAIGTHKFSDATLLKEFNLLSPKDSLVLTKVARQYQEAIWIAENEPQLSWLMLISSIEIAANHWRTSTETPLEKLEASKPQLLALLKQKGDDKFVNEIAREIAPYMGATKKFIDFILHFLPAPPEKRPHISHQVDWSLPQMKKSLRLIYDYRSKALHDGLPFPLQMCMPPMDSERLPITSYTLALGVKWDGKDLPMYLQTFEYIVRISLLKWWEQMLINKKPA